MNLLWFLANIDECESYPCQNDGTCNDEIDMYTCTCAPGYTDTHCESIRKLLLVYVFHLYDNPCEFNYDFS